MSRTRLAALFAAALAASSLVVLAAPAALAAGPVAAFTRTQDWGTGFEGRYTITNTGPAALSGWRVEFDLPATEQVGSVWDGVLTRTGNHYSVANAGWNGTVPAGGSASFGFTGSYSGAFVAPANCRLNGASCDGGPVDTTRPSTPTGLRVTGTTSASIALAWTAATDDVGVAGYRVREGGTVVATATGTAATVGGLAPSTSHTYTVSAYDAAGNESAPSDAVTGTTQTGPPPPPGGSLASAPYLMPLENNPPDIAAVMAATGVRTFTLAFILSDGGCNPMWSGGAPVATDTQMAATIAQIRAAGGDVMPSVGGWAGAKLGERCPDAISLANAYQRVIDRYGLRAIDFDIEATEFENAAAHDRITQAIRIIKERAAAAGRSLRAYVTVPVGQSGLTWWGGQLVQAAVRNAAQVDGWTIMPFDFGGGATGMGQLTVNVAEALHAQLRTYYPALSDDQLYRMSGISTMNGRTDVGEFVRQADFQTILGYARAHHLARFTFWSVNRDRQCSPAEPGTTSGTCSSVVQQPWEFTRIVAQYTG